jgi:hypothetical protein
MTACWLEGNTFGCLPGSVGAGGANPSSQIIYINAVDTEGEWPAGGGWFTVDAGKTVYDVDNGMPEDVIAVWLSGILIISPGYASEVADLHFYCRKPSTIPTDTYLCAQTCATAPAQGARTNFTTLVPVTNRKFEFWWYKSTGGYWPEHSSYGIIAWPIGYIK